MVQERRGKGGDIKRGVPVVAQWAVKLLVVVLLGITDGGCGPHNERDLLRFFHVKYTPHTAIFSPDNTIQLKSKTYSSI